MATEVEDKSVQLVLFEAIETALNDLLEDKIINSIEVFNSQTDFESRERPRLYPYVAVLIRTEWIPTRATNNQGFITGISQNEQIGNTTVTIYTVFENINTETISFKAAEPVRHLVHRAINLLSDDNYFTQLIRVNSDIDTSHNRVFTYVSQYSTQLTELAYKDSTKQVVEDVEIELTGELIIENETIRTAGEID